MAPVAFTVSIQVLVNRAGWHTLRMVHHVAEIASQTVIFTRSKTNFTIGSTCHACLCLSIRIVRIRAGINTLLIQQIIIIHAAAALTKQCASSTLGCTFSALPTECIHECASPTPDITVVIDIQIVIRGA